MGQLTVAETCWAPFVDVKFKKNNNTNRGKENMSNVTLKDKTFKLA